MTRRPAIALLALAGLAGAQTGAQSNPAAQAARAWRETHERAILGEFMGLLALPNVASDTEGIRRNAAAVSALVEKRGVKTRLLEVPGAPPAVYGEILTPRAARTPLFSTLITMASRSMPGSGQLRRGSRWYGIAPSTRTAA
jgi:hypothetical protein